MFNEIEMLNLIENSIKDAFSTDYWYITFGNKDMQFSQENSNLQSVFPVTYIELLNPIEYYRTMDSSLKENVTQFDFEIQQYNQAIKPLTKRDLGIMINEETKRVLQENFGFKLSSNIAIPSSDDTIYRRAIRGTAIYNNNTKLFNK